MNRRMKNLSTENHIYLRHLLLDVNLKKIIENHYFSSLLAVNDNFLRVFGTRNSKSNLILFLSIC